MLAGRMKLNTFLLLVGAGGGALVTGGMLFAVTGGAFAVSGADDPELLLTAPVLAAPGAAAPTPAPVAPPPVTDAPPSAPATARDVDAVVLSYQGKALGSDKLKDVTKGRPYKVNVYQDAGKPTANRAKIDLDRDDKWDEKITFDGEDILREVAPADDEAYTERTRWDGSSWVAP